MPKGKKGFQPGNDLGASPKYQRRVGKTVVTFRVYEDQEEAIRNIDGLAEILRKCIDDLISGQTRSNG